MDNASFRHKALLKILHNVFKNDVLTPVFKVVCPWLVEREGCVPHSLYSIFSCPFPAILSVAVSWHLGSSSFLQLCSGLLLPKLSLVHSFSVGSVCLPQDLWQCEDIFF